MQTILIQASKLDQNICEDHDQVQFVLGEQTKQEN